MLRIVEMKLMGTSLCSPPASSDPSVASLGTQSTH